MFVEPTHEEDELETAPCPVCGGQGTEMDVLGARRWFRCCDCGMEFSQDGGD